MFSTVNDWPLNGISFKVDDDKYALEVFSGRPYIAELNILNIFGVLPSRYLNGPLTYAFDSSVNGTIFDLFEKGISLLLTKEWFSYAQSGGAWGGAYRFAGVENGSYYYKLRDDFHFPNEWDTVDFDLSTPEVEDAYILPIMQLQNTQSKSPLMCIFL